jgi:hypothetical protein
MTRVYFDTNVYDRIDKGKVAPSDIGVLTLRASRQVRFCVSLTDFFKVLVVRQHGSSLDQLASLEQPKMIKWRMCQKQQMAWSRAGAH